MITETFDNKTNAIITPQRVADAPKVDACIQTFSWKIEEFVLAHFDCKKITSIWSATGETPVYCLDYKGKRFAFFKTYVGAPAAVANTEDALRRSKERPVPSRSFLLKPRAPRTSGNTALRYIAPRGRISEPFAPISEGRWGAEVPCHLCDGRRWENFLLPRRGRSMSFPR